jgi:riboflavin synthase
MFTGLIEEVGEIIEVRASDSGTQLRPQVASTRKGSVLQIAASGIAKKVRSGDSIAVNGCCLTLTSRRGNRLTFDLLEETIACTNLKNLRRSDPVNL